MGLSVLHPTEMVGQFSHLGSHCQDQILGVVELQPVTFFDKLTDRAFEVSERRFVVGAHVVQAGVERNARYLTANDPDFRLM